LCAAVGGGHGDGAPAPGRAVGPGGGGALQLGRPLAVCGRVGGYDRGGWGRFAHTVLVDMGERLRRSDRPDRVVAVALAAARQAGLVGRRRVLDSTPAV
jgi:hypothetical protein